MDRKEFINNSLPPVNILNRQAKNRRVKDLGDRMKDKIIFSSQDDHYSSRLIREDDMHGSLHDHHHYNINPSLPVSLKRGGPTNLHGIVASGGSTTSTASINTSSA
jgi:hypothetical protein